MTNQTSVDHTHNNVGLAFAMTIVAGLATAVGGAIVLVPGLAFQLQHRPKVLSSALGLAAGIMMYLAFVDLYPESDEFFRAGTISHSMEDLASLWAALCFFGGIGLMQAFDSLVHRLHPHIRNQDRSEVLGDSTKEVKEDGASEIPEKVPDPEKEVRRRAETGSSDSTDNESDDSLELGPTETRSLCQSGLATTVALILHNVPEGLITFTATAKDPAIGTALVFGIVLHNAPEGMSIALPIFSATGSKMKAMSASLVASLAPLLGGLIAYAILETREFSPIAFAVLYGVAAGILVYTAIQHLLKTAYKYDPEDKVTTTSFFLGMIILAIALVLLESTGNHTHGVKEENGHDASLAEGEEEWGHDQDHDDDHLRRR